jgi:hypothetical protein
MEDVHSGSVDNSSAARRADPHHINPVFLPILRNVFNLFPGFSSVRIYGSLPIPSEDMIPPPYGHLEHLEALAKPDWSGWPQLTPVAS